MEDPWKKVDTKLNILLHHTLNPGGRICQQNKQLRKDVKEMDAKISHLQRHMDVKISGLQTQTQSMGIDLGVLGEDLCRRTVSENLRLRPDLVGFRVQGISIRSLGDLCDYLKISTDERNKLLKHVRVWFNVSMFRELWTAFTDVVARVSQGMYGNQAPPKALNIVLLRMRKAEQVMLDHEKILHPDVTICLNIVKSQGQGYSVVMDHVLLLEEMHVRLKEGKLCTLQDKSLFMVTLFALKGELRHSIQLDMRGRVFRQLKSHLWSWTIRVGEIKLRHTASSLKKAKQQLAFFQSVAEQVIHIVHPPQKAHVDFVKFLVFGSAKNLDSLGFQMIDDICVVDASQISHLLTDSCSGCR